MQSGDVVIDATLGNGYDALFLAECVGEEGRVFGFDVQALALENTRLRLEAATLWQRVELYLASHAQMLRYLPVVHHGRVKAVMFNLGYLPGADKSLITQVDSTLEALSAACRLLAPQSIMTVLAYPGHAGGDREAELLVAWCANLDSACYQWELVLSHHDKPTAPRLFVIRKQADLL